MLFLGPTSDEDETYIAGADMGKQSLAFDAERGRRFLGAVEELEGFTHRLSRSPLPLFYRPDTPNRLHTVVAI